MEKLWKTNTLENCRLGKTKNALKWSSTRSQLEGRKNVSENCRLDAHTRWQGGYGWNYFRCRWNNCGKTFLFSCVLGNWIPY